MKNKTKVCGIIAEYNPFHNGHKYQLDIVKQSYDAVIAVMSGSFTQRGDVAIVDKWTRCRCALMSGADLVLELPTVYALSTADKFAFGGVSLLNSLGCVKALSFGSECGDINALKSAAEALIHETPEQSSALKELLKQGYPYAAAREKAFSDTIDTTLLKEPNNILATEYIKHLMLIGSKIEPTTHRRAGEHYNSTNINSPMASASAIRANINDLQIREQMPENLWEIFNSAPKCFLSNLGRAALSFIRINGANALKNTLECTEGIENRIYEASKNCTGIEQIAEACSSKRYTKAKIRRIILCAMLGIDADLCKEPPQYARILGATQKGRELLAQIKKNSTVELITKVADYNKDNKMFEKDILATDISSLCEHNIHSPMGKDYTTSPIMLK